MPLRGYRILAVDDNEMHNYAIARLLERRGHCEVDRAQNGEDAIKLAISHPPDAILLDVGLPDLNGWEVCRRLRQVPALGRTPIIFLTSTHQSTAAKDMAASVGADNLLFYPVSEEHLFTVLSGEIARVSGKHGTP
jgi:CheY-like chemotaxis protein